MCWLSWDNSLVGRNREKACSASSTQAGTCCNKLAPSAEVSNQAFIWQPIARKDTEYIIAMTVSWLAAASWER
jgi:hypothetical protein